MSSRTTCSGVVDTHTCAIHEQDQKRSLSPKESTRRVVVCDASPMATSTSLLSSVSRVGRAGRNLSLLYTQDFDPVRVLDFGSPPFEMTMVGRVTRSHRFVSSTVLLYHYSINIFYVYSYRHSESFNCMPPGTHAQTHTNVGRACRYPEKFPPHE